MKSFLITSAVLFVLGAVATVVVFFLINKSPVSKGDLPLSDTVISNVASDAARVEETLKKIPEAGIPLSTVDLSDTQKSTLEKVGVDTQSFVITKEMVACSVEKLGADRTEALMAGEKPSLTEMAKLTPCLTAGE